MKIVQQTPNQLTLRLRPVLIWVYGSIFVIAGLFLIASSKEVTFTCKRAKSVQGNCKLLTLDLLDSKVREILLNVLQGTKVEEDEDNSYRVVVLISDGEVPFTSYSSSLGKDEKQAIASQINDFIRTPKETTLMVQEDDRRLLYPVGGICFAVGFVAISMGQLVTCLFDKSLGSFTLKRQGLFGTEVIEHQIREIANVQMEEFTDSDGSTYRVSIVLTSGNCLPLTSYYSSGRKSKQETTERICTFLNLKN
jgi:hypothetical protein